MLFFVLMISKLVVVDWKLPGSVEPTIGVVFPLVWLFEVSISLVVTVKKGVVIAEIGPSVDSDSVVMFVVLAVFVVEFESD